MNYDKTEAKMPIIVMKSKNPRIIEFIFENFFSQVVLIFLATARSQLSLHMTS
ncbi:MAG: hypothetical protein MAG431_00773 [Chloroflexi bacterium]|nr:hypothetical protein [Chloroflexota bacterium]